MKSITLAQKNQNGFVYSLPRGGYLIKTSQGLLQIGAPPETIKDSILNIDDVPSIYCIGESFFSFNKGINLAELEFPIYYNFFIKRRKTIVVASKEICATFEKIFKLILFGETSTRVDQDYNPESDLAIPDIKKEISFFLNYSFDDILEFIPFNQNNEVVIGQIRITFKNHEFLIEDVVPNQNHKYKVPSSIFYPSFYNNTHSFPPKKVFTPPLFGMTCLGASHGFDPYDNTSGFIFWINGSGLLVDPPVNTTDILHDAGINPREISSMILTHIHADHDSGFFQKLLEQNRMTVYTTKTILDMWLYKYSLITSLSIDKIRNLFNFVPIIIDKTIKILGVDFIFRYMIHSLPTIGFTMNLRGKTITFSSDHLNEPVFFKELLDHKYIVKKRYDELMNFPWDSDVILHEAGIPPLHTPVTFLDSLPKQIKKKITLYHISKNSVPSDSKLVRCQSGIDHSITYKIKKEKDDEKDRFKQILSQINIFKQYGITDKQYSNLLSNLGSLNKKSLVPGEKLSEDYDPDLILIVLSGAFSIEDSLDPFFKNEKIVIPNYQLITGYNANNTTLQIKALTTTEILIIKKEIFQDHIDNKELLQRLAQGVSLDIKAWQALSGSTLYPFLTPTQRIDLINLLTSITVNKENGLYQIPSSTETEGLYIFHSGKGKTDHSLDDIGRGYCWGNLGGSGDVIKFDLKKTSPIEIYAGLIYYLSPSAGDFFLKENPGFYYRYNP